MSCAVCDEPALNRCSLCGLVRYCSRECQRNDWSYHKLRCGAAKAAAAATRGSLSGAMQWTESVPSEARAAWLVDCFRLRLTDVNASGGDPLGGPYASGTTRWEAVMELLIFARLAAAASSSGVLPPDWSWDAFCTAANPAVSEAFSDTDARIRYGPAGVALLRFVASAVYGVPADEGDRSAGHEAADAAVRRGTHGSSAAWLADAPLFERVGGAAAWSALLNGLPPVQCVAEAGAEGAPDAGDGDRARGSALKGHSSEMGGRGHFGTRSDAWELPGGLRGGRGDAGAL